MAMHLCKSRAARVAATGAILITAALLSGCLPEPCAQGNSGRFRCDPSVPEPPTAPAPVEQAPSAEPQS